MKIVSLTAENFKRLRAVEITPTGAVVQITGKNAQGKSSVLDAIWAAIGGAKHIQAVPIRKGETKARIRLDLGELIVERRFTDGGGTSITVENAEGARYKSPQAILDALVGGLSLDPLAFLHQEPKSQFETLRGLVPLEVDVDALDGLNRRDYEQRTEINRQSKALRTQAAAITVPTDLPDVPIDTSAIMDRLTAASTTNTKIHDEMAARDRESHAIGQCEADAVDLRTQIAILEGNILEIEADVKRRRVLLENLPVLADPVDVDAVRAELEAATAVNEKFGTRATRQKLETEAAEYESQAATLSKNIDTRTTQKTAAIAAAKMPVEGLGFGEGVVTFGGIPFDQASSAEQLRVSVALAMAANPKLRVIRIREGSLLDEENLAVIGQMAEAQDYSVWIERVDSSGKIGVVIDDGMVVAVDGQKVEASE